jgi:diguanylate cyclase (GGDEF)-like protein
MRASDDQGKLPDGVSPSVRDTAAVQRDHAAEDRDLAAQVRDELAGEDGQLSGEDRRLAARDRAAAAQDRRLAAADREAARHELAYEGLDALTGVMRRRVGLAAVQREMDRAERTGELLIVAFVDAVGLKAINDSRGHIEGDRVLREVASCITEDLRPYDLVTRIGGDEFVCTLSGQSLEQARLRYDEISQRLAERSNGAQMTVGLAAWEPGDSLEDLLDRADRAVIRDRR